MISNTSVLKVGLTGILVCFFYLKNTGQSLSEIQKRESEYYRIVDVPIPDDVVLEVGGLSFTDDNQLGVSTRRGEVWLVGDPYSTQPVYKKFASGLHEPLGLAYKDGGFYLSQRGELTRIEDKDGNGVADSYRTVYRWPLSGNYHDYSYGPKIVSNGDMLVTLNLGWQDRGVSLVKWRGWMLRITEQGEMTPIATGLRSPAGFGTLSNGDIFYTENQGDWVGSGRMTHLEVGDFAGNPEGLKWTDDPKSPLKLKPEMIDPEDGVSLYEFAKKVPELKPPAIWFPHAILGISTSDFLVDQNEGSFGPFEGQLLVGDQGHSKIMRVYLEKVNGVYQGAAFPFREGFSSGIIRMIWGKKGNMFVGMTSRGWASTGGEDYGLQRLEWTGRTPFEVKTMKALKDGFELSFTKPINKVTAEKLAAYQMTTFTYLYHQQYGSPVVDKRPCEITNVEVSEDRRKVTLTVAGMRLGYIHQLELSGIASSGGELLLHNSAYYTLNQFPEEGLKSETVENLTSGTDEIFNQPKRVNKKPLTWDDRPDRILKVGTKPGLKYDTDELTVSASDKVEITFNNNDDMLHNLVVVQQGANSADKVGEQAMTLGLDGEEMNYVPESDLVIAHTGILQPGSSEKIYFEAPEEPGVYWIVCTFPGHYMTMRAKLIVKE